MTRELLAIDFYGSELSAALAVLDEDTDTLRLRKAACRSCKSFAGAFVRSMSGAEAEFAALMDEMQEYTSYPNIIIGLRGNFLSFKHTNGMHAMSYRSGRVSQRDISAVLHNALPVNLDDSMDVVDVLPQAYGLDGNYGITDPLGLKGSLLEVDAFMSFALKTHLENLRNVLANCGYKEFQTLPTSIALGEALVKEDERKSGVLLIDIGKNASSVLQYHKEVLINAWEIAAGQEDMAEAFADLLQNDLQTAKEELAKYEVGTDPIVDEVLESAQEKLLRSIKKELLQSVQFVKFPPSQIILSGKAADKNLLKIAKQVFGVKRARLASPADEWTDCSVSPLPYAGALSLITATLQREVQEIGISRTNGGGWLDDMMQSFGLSKLFKSF